MYWMQKFKQFEWYCSQYMVVHYLLAASLVNYFTKFIVLKLTGKQPLANILIKMRFVHYESCQLVILFYS
jgi:uncharacterized membrane protein (DUF485 family)